MSRERGRCLIGTSGYQYRHWRGIFYPKSLPPEAWLSFYAQHFDTVEINNTFYRLPEASTFGGWRNEVGARFNFALKFSQYGSHRKHLKDPRDTTTRFVERARHLGENWGPILVQLPPRWAPDVERLGRFLHQAPQPPRWAIEVRDERWLCEPVYRVLRAHGAALCIHDLIPDHPRELTADWVYLRFHGNGYAGRYSHQYLTAQARQIDSYLARGLDVHAYFNNDAHGHALRNASELSRYLRQASSAGQKPGKKPQRVRRSPRRPAAAETLQRSERGKRS